MQVCKLTCFSGMVSSDTGGGGSSMGSGTSNKPRARSQCCRMCCTCSLLCSYTLNWDCSSSTTDWIVWTVETERLLQIGHQHLTAFITLPSLQVQRSSLIFHCCAVGKFNILCHCLCSWINSPFSPEACPQVEETLLVILAWLLLSSYVDDQSLCFDALC